MLNELGHWLNVGMFGDVLVICQRYISKLLGVVVMGDVWKLVFHHFKMLWLRVVFRKPNGEVGTKGFGHHISRVFFLKDVHVCCNMWLSFWGGCLVQLGRKDIICLSQTLMIHDVQIENSMEDLIHHDLNYWFI